MKKITDSILYVGCDDPDLDLFESQYELPNGMAYNSYVILDEKICVMDTADRRVSDRWLANVEEALGGRTPDYLVVQHMEPDHAGTIVAFMERYPDVRIVGNAKTFVFFDQFYAYDLTDRKVVVKEGDVLPLGAHTLRFLLTPMIHWPEVMMTYDETDKVFFTADAFGKFGTLDTDEDWACEARRYYFNIVGKYGAQVQMMMKKAAAWEIRTICPLHGPVLTENIEYYWNKYDIWSRYEPEDKGIFIAYVSVHGNTRAAAEQLKAMLESKGAPKVSIADLARDDMAEAVEDAFRYDRLVLAATTYDGGLFPCMEEFLHHLKAKSYQKRTVGIIENGSWAPMAGKLMRAQLEGMKEITVLEPVVTIKSSLKGQIPESMEQLANALIG